MNLITMVPATAKFFEQMRAMRRYIVENGVTEFAVFQNWSASVRPRSMACSY